MSNHKSRVIVVMPAYNAQETLLKTYSEIPMKFVDEVILVDDASSDRTVEVAKRMGLCVVEHKKNTGYGGNQKTCYSHAMQKNADIVVMVHPDYQYDPSSVPQMIELIESGAADIVLGSRMYYKKDALKGGMPLYKFISNIFLTTMENLVFLRGLSEYHTGLRAYSRDFLQSLDMSRFSDGFVFDTEIIAEAVKQDRKISEVPIKTRYLDDSSSISFKDSVIYGLKTLAVLMKYLKDKG